MKSHLLDTTEELTVAVLICIRAAQDKICQNASRKKGGGGAPEGPYIAEIMAAFTWVNHFSLGCDHGQ